MLPDGLLTILAYRIPVVVENEAGKTYVFEVIGEYAFK